MKVENKYYQGDIAACRQFLWATIAQKADENGQQWLNQKLAFYLNSGADRDFYLAFSAAARFVGKMPVQFDLALAESLRKGFQPVNWTLDMAARCYLLLHLPAQNTEKYLAVLRLLFETGDVQELAALYAALPLLPHPGLLVDRASEGIRTNITTVFDAVALHNPFPAEYLEEKAWNQLVLKAIFTNRPIYKIYGSDARANEELALMLSDYAHERWAAGRKVTPELWRFTTRFLHFPALSARLLADLEKVMGQGDPLQQQAAMLACLQNNNQQAHQLAESFPDVADNLRSGPATWDEIGRLYHNE